MYARELLGISELIADGRILQRLSSPLKDNETQSFGYSCNLKALYEIQASRIKIS